MEPVKASAPRGVAVRRNVHFGFLFGKFILFYFLPGICCWFRLYNTVDKATTREMPISMAMPVVRVRQRSILVLLFHHVGFLVVLQKDIITNKTFIVHKQNRVIFKVV